MSKEGGQGTHPGEFAEADFDFKQRYYKLSGYVLSLLTKVLKVNIALHADPAQIVAGDIFLFNHFARFETFVPPYLIYKHAHVMSHSVASPEFFRGNDAASKLLRGLGAIPSDYPNLFPFLGAEIIRGRKVIVFPEGGMVKDRRVVDRRGHFSVYSRAAKERRKHHVGAAVIAQGLEIFKEAVNRARKKGDDALLNKWSSDLGPDGREKLNAFSDREIKVVPANITFYPIRVDPNLLEQWAEAIGGELLTERLKEELRIEGNILLKDTDMDIRLGKPSSPGEDWTPLDKAALEFLLDQVQSIEDAYDIIRTGGGGAFGEIIAKRGRNIIFKMRDRYMRDIYAAVSVNLSQLASALVYKLVEEKKTTIDAGAFNRSLYIALKKLQPRAEVALHRSLVDPDYYGGVEEGRSRGLAQFMDAAVKLGLMETAGENLVFQERLTSEIEFDQIRVENPIAVYANEVRPLGAVEEALSAGLADEHKLSGTKLALLRFDDELVSYRFDKFRYSKDKYKAINDAQTAKADSKPYLLRPEVPKPVGVVLVHGFSASPWEMRGLAEYLHSLGYAVLGVRLKGHGTSPWDLKERSRRDWADSVARARAIMAGLTEKTALVGFSMGGLLALRNAAADPSDLAGLVTACAPIKFRDKGHMIVEIVHRVNDFVGIVSHHNGFKPFHTSSPENPEVNYRHLPIRAVHELEHLAAETPAELQGVTCPTLILQGDNDPRVAPESAQMIYSGISTGAKTLITIPTDLHGIIYRDIGGCHKMIGEFLERI